MLQLDPRVAFEALVLSRLERIPEARRQEWLRGLLVQGFRHECQGLKAAQDEVAPRRITPAPGRVVSPNGPRSAFAAWLAKPASRPDGAIEAVGVVDEEKAADRRMKPFAGLRKVIG
ncbi:MAG: hypothetical protein AB1810_09020 [Pseudomonadota bacterium]